MLNKAEQLTLVSVWYAFLLDTFIYIFIGEYKAMLLHIYIILFGICQFTDRYTHLTYHDFFFFKFIVWIGNYYWIYFIFSCLFYLRFIYWNGIQCRLSDGLHFFYRCLIHTMNAIAQKLFDLVHCINLAFNGTTGRK